MLLDRVVIGKSLGADRQHQEWAVPQRRALPTISADQQDKLPARVTNLPDAVAPTI